ncbi:MAG: hypothetical protein ABJ364_07920 [Lentilitoribacter sp.]
MMQGHTLIEMARELRLAGFADALELHADKQPLLRPLWAFERQRC